VELARGETTWQFIEVKARPFVTLWADARASDDPTQTVLQEIGRRDVRDAIVRVNVKLKAHQEASLHEKDISSALKEANYIAAISKDIERETRARLGGATPEGLSPIELLERYLESKGTEPERLERLMECARKITADVSLTL
jgi:exonuclease SbcD